jgi:hypothetical protein
MTPEQFASETKHLSESRLLDLGAFIESYCFVQWAIHKHEAAPLFELYCKEKEAKKE